ncbi:ABC transporter transmembrane domain-containing protein, partial [Enterococcus faecalis]|uniref:ABC transporter transmembrane domain-containing protein n=1 Tax=Enterococcus faecalis TaxID=1351 RepID=UPI003D6B1359
VTNVVHAVSNAMQQSFINIVSGVLGIVMAGVMMFLINPLMAIFSVFMIPLSLIISSTIVKISQKYFQGMQNSLDDLNG